MRVEAADGQTLRDPQAGVFELRPLCRLPCYYGREKGWKKWITSVRGGKARGDRRRANEKDKNGTERTERRN